MRCRKEDMLLYAVTDRAWVGKLSLYAQVEAALQNGITCLQLREKELDAEHFLEEAKTLAALCRRYNVPFIVNDNVEIALACGADGVHVGQEDQEASAVRQKLGPDKILGVSVHSLEEARQAKAASADYLGLGAVFSTSTKLDVDILPRELIRQICTECGLPTVAIGGINAGNLLQLSGCGLDGVAVVSAIFAAADPGAATAALLPLARRMVKGNE
ncbi:MAG: thiamine phosphate synthase [Bacillota bacterium]|nr:thiamine phosphate synthase [Bacillota bacterium]